MAEDEVEYTFSVQSDDSSEEGVEYAADDSSFFTFLDEEQENSGDGEGEEACQSGDAVVAKEERRPPSAANLDPAIAAALRKEHQSQLRAKGKIQLSAKQVAKRKKLEMRKKRKTADAEREMGKEPMLADLQSAVFSNSSVFDLGECVLIPKSRGGFVYGTILGHRKPELCCSDPRVRHEYYEWRGLYKNFRGRKMVKDLPSAFLGKLQATVPAASSTEEGARALGTAPNYRDLCNVRISPKHSFVPGETVLVPRSTGGWSYGQVGQAMAVLCTLPKDKSLRHKVKGFRVYVNASRSARKDLVPGSIGKLPVSQSLPPRKGLGSLAMTLAAPEVRDDGHQKKAKNNSRKRTSSGARNVDQAFAEMNGKREEPSSPLPADEDLDEQILWKPLGSAAPEPALEPSRDEKRPEAGSGGMLQVDMADVQKALPVAANAPDKKAKKKRKKKKKPLVVIDAPNVAMKHGKQASFSAAGILICMKYWEQRGYEVVGFLPENYLSTKPSASSAARLSDYINRVDDVPLVRSLVDEGKLVLTPPWDYDDSYCIQYAKEANGIIVTNDRYWDHVEKYEGQQKGKVAHWVRQHCVSYTFAKDTFMPNPDFEFPKYYAGKNEPEDWS